ncbi:response regulator [Pseudomonas sp. CDFA 602]|uniref:response regulator n=1 Tax=Pseudomonas californiensis TaxID=2829823 RepID=UPI001E37D726|nr:response regulator [Pseudomonas californiensis]MCD5995740.1 response regulator [Pseudomonas californiensis]MCD6001407.1 response regulator [Pseudomonas californiensis]
MAQSQQYGNSPSDQSVVLVVEDEQMIRDFVCEILETDAGLRTKAVENADEAMTYLQQHTNQVALLLTDVRMPGSMDGIGLANRVGEQWSHIPIVVMSGHGTPGSDQLKKDVLFIAKPWTITQLVSGVMNSLGSEYMDNLSAEKPS